MTVYEQYLDALKCGYMVAASSRLTVLKRNAVAWNYAVTREPQQFQMIVPGFFISESGRVFEIWESDWVDSIPAEESCVMWHENDDKVHHRPTGS